MDIENSLIDFIKNKIVYDQDKEQISLDEPLLEGLLDSTDILRLVVFIEEQFRIQVKDDELVPENFNSVKKVADFVRQKSTPAA